jgi:hypothetical protein
MVLAWLLDPSVLSACLGVDVKVSNLRAAAWSVYRIGSREGLASVVDAGMFSSTQITYISEGNVFESILYQPEDCAKPLSLTPEVILYDTAYRERSYLVPGLVGGSSGIIPPHETQSFELKSGCRAARPHEAPHLTISYPIT